MTRDSELIGLLEDYLDDVEGHTYLPDTTRDAIRARLPLTSQRPAWWPGWRFPEMNTMMKYGLGAAAALLVALVGFTVLNGGGASIGSPDPTVSPTATPAALPGPGRLDAGTYYVNTPNWDPAPYSITVPGGWELEQDGFVTKDPDGPGEVRFATWMVTHVFSDACNDSRDNLVGVGTTVDELASALIAQENRTASQSTATLGGFPATRLELSFPAELDPAACRGRAWPGPGPDMNSGMVLRDGQTHVVYILDIGGDRMVVVASHMPDSTEQDVAELQGLLDSLRIEQ